MTGQKAEAIAPIYTVRDVAEQYKVTPQTVYNWISAGRMNCLRLTGTVRFRPKHLEEFEARAECDITWQKPETETTKRDGRKTDRVDPVLSALKTKSWRKSG